jgi:hypothetical protein
VTEVTVRLILGHVCKVMTTHSFHVCFGLAGVTDIMVTFKMQLWSYLCNLIGKFSSE